MSDSVDKARTTEPVLDGAIGPTALPLDVCNEFDQLVSHDEHHNKQKNLFDQEQFYLKCIFHASKYSVGMDDGWQTRLIDAINAATENGETIKGITVKADVNRSQIDDMMRKGTRPRVDTFLKLCRALKISPFYVLTGIDQDRRTYQILSLFGILDNQQQSVFITMMQSFARALGKTIDAEEEGNAHIEQEEFLTDETGQLNAMMLQRASRRVREQELELTDRAIFHFEEFDRRLKIEYNKLYLSESVLLPSSNKKNSKN